MRLVEIEEGLHALIVGLRITEDRDRFELLRELRDAYKDLAIQAVDPRFIASLEHVELIVKQAYFAKTRGLSYAEQFEIDLLMRIACTDQITKAVATAGLKANLQQIVLIAIGSPAKIALLQKDLSSRFVIDESVFDTDVNKQRFLKEFHNIRDLSLNSLVGFEDPLSRILVERAILLKYK